MALPPLEIEEPTVSAPSPARTAADDELVEVTPKIVRVRKHILSTEQRRKFERRGLAEA